MHKKLITSIGYLALAAVQCSCLTPTEYALSNTPSAADVTGIQQTLGLFSVAIDLKQFDLLGAVFAPNATANFTGHSVSVGLPAITSYLTRGLTGLKTQHDLGTLYINMTGPATATSYNWLQGTFFGTGSASGQTLSNFGYYKDDLVKSRGRWLIQNRVLGNFVSIKSYSTQTLLHFCNPYMSVKNPYSFPGRC